MLSYSCVLTPMRRRISEERDPRSAPHDRWLKSETLSMLFAVCTEDMLDVTVAVKAETSTTPKIIQKTAMIRPAIVAGVLSP